MKAFVKILVAIIIVAALCGGIYLVLPETAQIFVKGNIQYRTDDNAKTMVDKIKGLTIAYTETQSTGVDREVNTSVTYGDALTNKSKSTVWYYEESGSSFKVTFYGTKVSMDLSKYGSDGTYVDKTLKVVFDFPTPSNGSITVYIGDEQCNDAMKSAVLKALVD